MFKGEFKINREQHQKHLTNLFSLIEFKDKYFSFVITLMSYNHYVDGTENNCIRMLCIHSYIYYEGNLLLWKIKFQLKIE